ncbi:hypothetical protein [Thalassotalea fusca]
MKNITTVMTAGLVLLSTATFAQEVEQDTLDVKVALGSVYTELEGFDGEGYRTSATLSYLLPETSAEIYGRASYQASHERSDVGKMYLDEGEYVVGIAIHADTDLSFYVETGDLTQTLERGNEQIANDIINVSRLGATKIFKNSQFDLAIEHRNGAETDFGYRMSISPINSGIGISYTDIGGYQSIGINFEHKF